MVWFFLGVFVGALATLLSMAAGFYWAFRTLIRYYASQPDPDSQPKPPAAPVAWYQQGSDRAS